MVAYNQHGYVGSSMSVRAMAAYDRGEKPLSKWTKTGVLAAWKDILAGDIDPDMAELLMFDPESLKTTDTQAIMTTLETLPKSILLGEWLIDSSWHHTGKYANRTNFYSPNLTELGIVIDISRDEGIPVGEAIIRRAKRFATTHWIDWTDQEGAGHDAD